MNIILLILISAIGIMTLLISRTHAKVEKITENRIENLYNQISYLKEEHLKGREYLSNFMKNRSNDDNDTFEYLEYIKLSDDAQSPLMATEGDAGYDLYNAETKVIKPKERTIVKTDIAINLPKGYYAMVTSRSSVSLKTKLTVHTGIIDSNYSNGIGVIVENTSEDEVLVLKGERLAQMLILKHEAPIVKRVDAFYNKEVQKDGFGSSGK